MSKQPLPTNVPAIISGGTKVPSPLSPPYIGSSPSLGMVETGAAWWIGVQGQSSHEKPLPSSPLRVELRAPFRPSRAGSCACPSRSTVTLYDRLTRLCSLPVRRSVAARAEVMTQGHHSFTTGVGHSGTSAPIIIGSAARAADM